jgi:hypothetical protein
MSYVDRFQLVDGLVSHLDAVIVPTLDPFLRTRYVGFVCVSAVTVMELAVRDILIEFATKKHRVFGAFCQDLYERLNGRIMLDDLRKNHIKRFGDRYVSRFVRLLDAEERRELSTSGRSVKASYGNLITWRNSFAHQGVLPPNASYAEAKQGLELGKQVLHCLDAAMIR